MEWVIPFPGDWHMLKKTQPVLFKVYLDAGLRKIAETTFKADGLLNSLIKYSNLQKYFDYLKAAEKNLHAINPDAMFKFVIHHISTVENSPDSLLEKERKKSISGRIKNVWVAS